MELAFRSETRTRRVIDNQIMYGREFDWTGNHFVYKHPNHMSYYY